MVKPLIALLSTVNQVGVILAYHYHVKGGGSHVAVGIRCCICDWGGPNSKRVSRTIIWCQCYCFTRIVTSCRWRPWHYSCWWTIVRVYVLSRWSIRYNRNFRIYEKYKHIFRIIFPFCLNKHRLSFSKLSAVKFVSNKILKYWYVSCTTSNLFMITNFLDSKLFS